MEGLSIFGFVLAGLAALIFNPITIVLAIGLWYYLPGFKLNSATKKLGNQSMSEEAAQDYLNLVINLKRIPNQPYYWNNARAGFELIRSSDSVSKSTKENLRVALLSKGVVGLRQV